ncbi:MULTISPECIES: sulfite exporter TauE/SafE family protein [unclassified Adlercreutzia]|uniref:sulfite exporter TauE/SafE family protein n=1 Tax=unclassified Adlercreutzia TaxID=2636013 RepID=UPI0013ED9E09|nr:MULTISPECIES: sulfite exporter TauE/SafE family protein [unclassified Adlercreutzia]
MIAASLAVGLFVGVLSGLLGIGGGTILVPVLKLGYALEPIVSTATSMFTIIPTSVSGAITHVRHKTCLPKLGVAAGVGGALTSPVGVWLATRSEDWMIMVAAACVIAYSAITMLQKALAAPKAGRGSGAPEAAAEPGAAAAAKAASSKPASAPAAASAPASTSAPAPAAANAPAPSAASALPRVTTRQVVLTFLIGMVAGVASGYVGLGGGFLIVPMLVTFVGLPMRLTSGTSLISVMILAVPGVVYQGMLGNVDWIAGIAIACGSIPGAALSARYITKIPERALRLAFGCFLLVAAALLVVDQAGVI